MKNIKDFLAMVFCDISAHDILNENTKIRYDNLNNPDIMKLMERRQPRYSRSELIAQLFYFQDICEERNEEWTLSNVYNTNLDIFSLMFYYTSRFLTFQGDEICCKYSDLLHWRMLTLEMSEDMLICAFLADYDAREHIRRTIFDWPVVIGHNNTELNMILRQGMAENHFHLKGSAPAFHLAWCYFMNNRITDQDRIHLNRINETSRKVTYSVSGNHKEDSLEFQIVQAAAIRMYLFRRLTEIPAYEKEEQRGYIKSNRRIIEILHMNDFSENPAIVEEIYTWIMDLRMLMMTKGIAVLDDYAVIEKNIKGSYTTCEVDHTYPANLALYRGERHFMYLAFLAIRLNYSLTDWEKNLFFVYLVIRERVRSEILQNNSANVGFENFSIFEERKSYFTAGDILAREAMQEVKFFSGVQYLEARICPWDSAEDNVRLIRKMDQCIGYDSNSNVWFGYIMHFVKEQDDSIRNQNLSTGAFICRHDSLRRKISQQADALIGMREQYPEIAMRVVGIDACNQEIGCRPEVFASVFRRLKKHIVRRISNEKNLNVPQLRITYHVGEDFLDPLDGLRAIDESIHFLQMGCGDRLGHALALGIDTDEWYEQKGKLLIPCQDYLDNIVWLYFALSDYNIDGMDSLKIHLEDEFQNLFNRIYRPFIRKAMTEKIIDEANEYYSRKKNIYYGDGTELKFDIYHYYQSCLLRGDDPEYYARGYFKNDNTDDYRKNPHKVNWEFPEKFDVRMIPEAALLYYYYHFDANVKKSGSRYMSKKPHPDYKKAVRLVQKKMQEKIAVMGICIEANPTSNYLIGTFKRYDKHPIIKWYNYSLETDRTKIEESPQLSVSINTDDMGVFSTRLDMEYSLMALALERACDENGRRLYDKNMIYNWIDDIRKFGLRQNFLHQNQKLDHRKED